jgi:hypothetical protein
LQRRGIAAAGDCRIAAAGDCSVCTSGRAAFKLIQKLHRSVPRHSPFELQLPTALAALAALSGRCQRVRSPQPQFAVHTVVSIAEDFRTSAQPVSKHPPHTTVKFIPGSSSAQAEFRPSRGAQHGSSSARAEFRPSRGAQHGSSSARFYDQLSFSGVVKMSSLCAKPNDSNGPGREGRERQQGETREAQGSHSPAL